MDIVFIRQLRMETIIGVYPWERSIKQLLLLDLDLAWDIQPAAAEDNLTLALDYKALSDGVIAMVAGTEFLLIETLAEKIAQYILQEFSVPWLSLTLHKPNAITGAQTLGVKIERGVRPS